MKFSTKMNKYLYIVASLLLFSSCEKQKEHKCISPMASGIEVEALSDCTVPASFTTDDFRWMGGNLRMTVYREDLYDAVEVSQMQLGDTLVYQGNPLVITSLEEENGTLNVNGGVEMGGCWLQGYEGGTYRAYTFDDHSIYNKLGTAEVALSEDFIIIDCHEFPDEPSDTIRTDQKLYLQNLQDYRKEFYSINTRVVIENGMVTEINRHWIP